MRPLRIRYLPHIANLQPWREELSSQALRRMVTGLVLCLGAAIAVYSYQQHVLEEDRAQQTAQLDRLEQELAQSKKQQQKLIASSIPFSSLINAQRIYFALALLQQDMPGQAKIRSLELGRELVIEGSTYQKAVLPGFVEALKTRELVSEAALRQVSERGEQWDFTLGLELDAEVMNQHTNWKQ